MKRFCPSEEVLGEYVSGCLPEKEKPSLEEHLVECEKCRTLVCEAHEAMKIVEISDIWRKSASFAKKNIWLLASSGLILTSFLFPRYFFQFLGAGIIAGLKWAVSSKGSGTVIMINGSREHTSEKLSGEDVPRDGK